MSDERFDRIENMIGTLIKMVGDSNARLTSWIRCGSGSCFRSLLSPDSLII